MTETTVRQAHFRVDAKWLGEFIRTAYWYEHKHIYAKLMFNDMGLPEEYYLKILNGEVTLSNDKDGECQLINKTDKKAQKETKKQLEWLDKAYIKLENGRYLLKEFFDDYVKNEWRRRRQADFLERYSAYSDVGLSVIKKIRSLRETHMKNMLDSTGVTTESEMGDFKTTERLIIMATERDYRLNGLKPFPFENYEEAIKESTQKEIWEVFNEMDEIYTREFARRMKGETKHEPVLGKLPPLKREGEWLTEKQLERYGDGSWGIAVGEERGHSAFVDPKGVWWNVKFANHQQFANWTIWKNYPEYDGYTEFEHNRAVDVLVQLGWVLVNDQHGYGISIVGDMNVDQYIALYDVFGNKVLANGTIKALWMESPYYKEN